MIEVYEPSNSVVMVYINNNGEMSASMTPQTQPTPGRVLPHDAGDNITHNTTPSLQAHCYKPLLCLALKSKYGKALHPKQVGLNTHIASCQCVSPSFIPLLLTNSKTLTCHEESPMGKTKPVSEKNDTYCERDHRSHPRVNGTEIKEKGPRADMRES